ncbi:MAG: hypothetical protein VB021_02680 [Oscillospiraceae bacterium]|nr:hypothetical protein [Oscillospiraceae bacterium]
MPDYLSHSLFADALLSADFPLRDVCARHAALFRFGSQGPDLFYYCAVIRPRGGYAALADGIHDAGSDLPVLALLREARRDGASDAALAYLLGFLAHLHLDGAAHPFICEKAKSIAAQRGVSEGCAHVQFESTIEARELFETRGIAPQRFRVRADLPQDAGERRLTASLCCGLCSAWGLPAPREDRLAADIALLPALFAVLFDKCGAARAVLDAKYALTGRDFAARWHIKRPFRPETAADVLSDDAYARYRALEQAGKESWLAAARTLV